MPQTLAEKVWERHVVHRADGEPDLLYVDLHLVHEVTSPQAFEGLRHAGRKVRRPDLTFATADHNVPTDADRQNIKDPLSLQQINTLHQPQLCVSKLVVRDVKGEMVAKRLMLIHLKRQT